MFPVMFLATYFLFCVYLSMYLCVCGDLYVLGHDTKCSYIVGSKSKKV